LAGDSHWPHALWLLLRPPVGLLDIVIAALQAAPGCRPEGDRGRSPPGPQLGSHSGSSGRQGKRKCSKASLATAAPYQNASLCFVMVRTSYNWCSSHVKDAIYTQDTCADIGRDDRGELQCMSNPHSSRLLEAACVSLQELAEELTACQAAVTTHIITWDAKACSSLGLISPKLLHAFASHPELLASRRSPPLWPGWQKNLNPMRSAPAVAAIGSGISADEAWPDTEAKAAVPAANGEAASLAATAKAAKIAELQARIKRARRRQASEASAAPSLKQNSRSTSSGSNGGDCGTSDGGNSVRTAVSSSRSYAEAARHSVAGGGVCSTAGAHDSTAAEAASRKRAPAGSRQGAGAGSDSLPDEHIVYQPSGCAPHTAQASSQRASRHSCRGTFRAGAATQRAGGAHQCIQPRVSEAGLPGQRPALPRQHGAIVRKPPLQLPGCGSPPQHGGS